MIINDILNPVKQNLESFNSYLTEMMNSDVALLDKVLTYINQKKGKQFRPALVFLCAEACGGVNKRSFIGAAMMELLHTATLVHDDVVDEASERRGRASVNAEWDNKIAVLIGDFLLAKGLLAAIDGKEFMFLNAASKAVRRMSEGELLSIDRSVNLEVDEKTYFRIISDKTASLTSACCEIGAISASDSPEIHNAMTLYGEQIGIAFQIRDDIFDYTSKSFTIGKPVGNDLKEKKLTLPLIYSLSNSSPSESSEILMMIKNGNLSKKEIKHIIEFTKTHKGIEYADAKAYEYSNSAIETIGILPESPAKKSLKKLAGYVIERKK